MILYRKISLQLLSEQGKAFKWEDQNCEQCQRPMWGHGRVSRYFAELSCVVHLKRFRCPECGTVGIVRPTGYWPRIRSSIQSIYFALKTRLESQRWHYSGLRQRAGHWLLRFMNKARMDGGSGCEPAQFLKFCFEKNLSFFV